MYICTPRIVAGQEALGQAAHECGERGDARGYGGRVHGACHELSVSVGGGFKEDPEAVYDHEVAGELDGAGARQVSGGTAIVSGSLPGCG